MAKSKTASVLVVSIATFISRILGLVREQIFAFILGATSYADAYLVSFRIPNLLRDLFAEGVFSTAFVPTFAEYLVKKGKKRAFELANKVLNSLSLIIIIITIFCFLFTPHIIKIIAPGFTVSKEKFELTVIMTRILFPFLLFIALASVMMGILNVHHKFFIPALAPALFNLVIIIFGIIIMILKPDDKTSTLLWSLAALLGGFVQFAIQVPFASKLGLKYRFVIDIELKEEGLRKILKILLPVVIGFAAIQINIIINTMIASLLPEGSVAYLNYAFRLIQLPIGLFGVAIASVTTTFISHNVAKNDIEELKFNIADSIKLTSFLTMPSIFYFIFLGDTIIALLFQHGRFGLKDTLNTFNALKFYSFSIFFYSGVKIFAPVFYATEKSYKAVIASITGVITNIIVNIFTYKSLGIKGLALGLSAGSFANFCILAFNFVNQFGIISNKKIIVSISKHLIASILMVILSKIALNYFKSHVSLFFSTIIAIIIAGLTYIISTIFLKSEEIENITKIIRNRFLKS